MWFLVTGQVTAYDLFYDLFLSPELWGYFGPLGLILAGHFLSKKDTILGLVWFIVECLFVGNYLTLVEATPDYWWRVFIILVGGILVFAFHLTTRKR